MYRKVGITSSHHAPYALGRKRVTMLSTTCCKPAMASKSLKTHLSPDKRLQFAFLKLESLVIPCQLYRGEYVPRSCTHRPSNYEREGHSKTY